MITRIRMQNLLSLRDLTLELGSFHVFIGPNAAGKSAIFKSLLLLSRLLNGVRLWFPKTGPLMTEGAMIDQLVWRGDTTLPIIFELWFNGNTEEMANYLLEIRKVGESWNVTKEVVRLGSRTVDTSATPVVYDTQFHGTITWKVPYPAPLSTLTHRHRADPVAAPAIAPFRKVADEAGRTWRYRISAEDVAAPVYFPSIAHPGERPRAPSVEQSGRGLAAVLQNIQGAQRPLFAEIERTLREWFPHIQSINFAPVPPAGVRLAFTTNRSQALVPASMESDGVLHGLVLIWRGFDAIASDLVCIEEPENGLHPYRLRERYEFLKRLATAGLRGYPVRAFVATHSPDFLNAMANDIRETDLLRIVEFDREQGTRVYRLQDMAQFEVLAKVFKSQLGELWWSGAMGGVPKG